MINLFATIERILQNRKAELRLLNKIRAIQKIFLLLEKEIARFQKLTRLVCASGCGQCCENPRVESTLLEMLPLGLHLHEEGRAEFYIEKAEKANLTGQCIFYQPHPSGQGKGRCSVYSIRPLICRLFGFSARIDKHGQPALVTCPVIKTLLQNEYERANQLIRQGTGIPIMSHYAQRLSHIDPSLAQDYYPINHSLKLSLEYIGLRRKKWSNYFRKSLS